MKKTVRKSVRQTKRSYRFGDDEEPVDSYNYYERVDPQGRRRYYPIIRNYDGSTMDLYKK